MQSTVEFNKFINDIVIEGKVVDVSKIINNKNLLPVEKIALIVANNILKTEKLFKFINFGLMDKK